MDASIPYLLLSQLPLVPRNHIPATISALFKSGYRWTSGGRWHSIPCASETQVCNYKPWAFLDACWCFNSVDAVFLSWTLCAIVMMRFPNSLARILMQKQSIEVFQPPNVDLMPVSWPSISWYAFSSPKASPQLTIESIARFRVSPTWLIVVFTCCILQTSFSRTRTKRSINFRFA